MATRKNRLELRAALLELIDRHRNETGDPDLGYEIERAILEEDLRQIQQDIFSNPGALEAQLVPVRTVKPDFTH